MKSYTRNKSDRFAGRMGKFSSVFLISFVSLCLIFVLPIAASETIEFTLAWDANSEETIDGYEIYYGTPGSDYKFIGDVYVDELADPENPMVKITDLYNGAMIGSIIPAVTIPPMAMTDGGIYYFALTAFDVHGNTSDFSEEICLQVSGSDVFECSPIIGDGVSSKYVNENDGSDDVRISGGCFIFATSL